MLCGNVERRGNEGLQFPGVYRTRSQRIPDANFADWTSVDRLLVPLSRHLNLTAETATLVPELMTGRLTLHIDQKYKCSAVRSVRDRSGSHECLGTLGDKASPSRMVVPRVYTIA
ncbi:hypothetical protein POSPLADRAFT_1035538 [Postia placenta MAD-698-R-SB12]|uniref:Uncharacterized protein n=1 Tax=Postia placenta MAD-698-R-SB12 TaxID=670580 RepID=A0A1X6MRZ5_9APHY|nr:hypothetical protein POSPLADRAFT_1035538 [Postia placenta MAD-698-R-SB12]OSX59161.1 hypothetical protein POSPLADRAFT_1035538 [Postia placenta MAD-698-R-SB12]